MGRVTEHEHEWTALGLYGRRCPCGIEEFEFSDLEWAEATARIERGKFRDQIEALGQVPRRLPELPYVVSFDTSPLTSRKPDVES